MKKGKILISDMLLVLVLFIGSYVDNVFCYFFSCIFIILNIIKNKTIKLDYIYISILGIGVLSSLIHFNVLTMRNVIRDFYYFSIGFVFILCGYYICYNFKNKKKLIKDVYYFIFISLLFKIFYLFCNIILGKISIDFQAIRDFCRIDSELVATSLAVLITYSNSYMLEIFDKRQIKLLIIVETIALLCSFSRTGYTIFLIMMILLNSKYVLKFRKNTLKIILGVISIVFIIVCIIPKSFTQPFIEKYKKSMTELSSGNNWNDTTITQNWRGYELYETERTYQNSSYLEKIIGNGFGKLIKVRLSELVGISESEGGITILHNGYAMLLIKTGILGVVLFALWMLKYFYKGYINKANIYSQILMGLMLVIAFDTYVVSGLFKAAVSFSFAISIGIVIAMQEIRIKELHKC